MRFLVFIHFILFSCFSIGQVIPIERTTDWTLAGLRDTTTIGFQEVNMNDFGAVGDGQTANDMSLNNALGSITSEGAIIQFPPGQFLFNDPITLPDNVVLKGMGADATTLQLDLGGFSHGINISGNILPDISFLDLGGNKGNPFIIVIDQAPFSVGDWVKIIQEDADLTFSAWAAASTGQIVQIESIAGDTLFLNSPLRADYPLNREPFIQKLDPVSNVGVECLKIERLDNTAPDQFSNIFFSNAVNCWVRGIESNKCTFSHVEIGQSSNINIRGSYFHDAFEFGGGGRAYGVMIHFTSNECLVENNIFDHLRHSMILQAGANGNVFAYNYSTDPTWTSFPADAAGDLVLHGNYPYLNLFEQNIGQNIVIDNSHGLNGPHNTFFRNRGEHYGIFFSADNSPSQNLVGNEVTNTSLPQSLLNYTILGDDQYLYGNNDEGTITPSGTEDLDDPSYAYDEIPDFLNPGHWAAIGTPNDIGTGTIPAKERFDAGAIFAGECGNVGIGIDEANDSSNEKFVYPNPTSESIFLENYSLEKLRLDIYDCHGNLVHTQSGNDPLINIRTNQLANGMYLLKITEGTNFTISKIFKY